MQDKLTEDEEKHLSSFENNLSQDILEEFNSAWFNQTWPRDVQMRGLYKYWLDISRKPGFDKKDKPSVKKVTLVNVNFNRIRQEQSESENNLIDNQASIFDNEINDDKNLNDEGQSSNQEFPLLINNPTVNKAESSELLYEIVIANEPLQIISQTQSVIGESCDINSLNLSDILTNNVDDKLIIEPNVLDAINQTDSFDTNSATTTATTADAFVTPDMDENLKAQKCEKFSELVISKENDSQSANKIETVENPFESAFRMPTKYLPKKKKIKLESSGKPKLPSAGTSDQWVLYHSKKATDRQIKEEKQQKKKQLIEEKKLIAEERKKLQEKLKAIQQKIKEETK